MIITHIRKMMNTISCTPRKMFLFSLAVLILFYLPAFLCLYPGTLGYDGPAQLVMYYGEKPMTLHHPVFHTWLLGSLITAGQHLFGSLNAGLALYCAVQGIVVAVSLAGVFWFLRRYAVPFPVLAVMLLWTACNPYLQAMTFTTTKDVLFSAFFLDFLMLLLLVQDETAGHQKAILILLGIMALLTCMTRNQGIYLVAGSFLFMLLLNRKWKVLAVLAGAVCCMLCINAVNTHLLHFEKGDAREMLSVPMQQEARVMHFRDAADITEEQEKMVLRVIPEEGLEQYDEWISDPVKNYVKTDELKKDLPGYIRVYLQLGRQNPVVYWTAFDKMVSGFFRMSEMHAQAMTFTWTFTEYSERWGFHQEDRFHAYRRLLTGLIDPETVHAGPFLNGIQPVLVIFQPVAAIVICAAALALSLMRRRRSILIIGLLSGLYFVSMLLGPAALLRYALPLMMQVPLYVGLGFIMLFPGRRPAVIKEEDTEWTKQRS